MALVKPLGDLPFVRANPALRAFVIGAWLGWQIESNWARPLLFAIYAVARPLASALLLVIMYSVITNGATQEPLFAFIFIGNALYIVVSSVVSGISWAVIDDREHYRVMKQLHTAPMSYYSYLIGRGVARVGIGLTSFVITMLVGVVFFQLPIALNTINWGLLILASIVGIIAMQGIGVILGAITMQLASNLWFLGEGTIAALYLFAGAIFPLDVLPEALQPFGMFYPVTYWIELSRRALLGANAPTFHAMGAIPSETLLLILTGMALFMAIASYIVYRLSLHRAKEMGRLDMETSF